MTLPFRKNNVIGILVATAILSVVTRISNLLQLSDRSRYLQGSSNSANNPFSRTEFTEFLFGLSPLTEPILVLISILLLFRLCQRLIESFQLLGRQQSILYLVAFAPSRLLFRSYASKELLFTIFCQLLLLYLLSLNFSKVKLALSFRFKPSRSLYPVLYLGLLLFPCFLLRPFYAAIFVVPLLISFPQRYFSPRTSRNLLITLLLSGSLFLCLVLLTPNYHLLARFMNGYFLIDGANANSTRLFYEIPDNGLSFIRAFLGSLLQPLIGPYLSEVIDRPLLFVIFLEGIFFVYFFGLILGCLISPARTRILSSSAFTILFLSLLYILFVYYIFSIINFMAGIRFQSCSVALLLYLYSYSANIYNSSRASSCIP